MEPNTEKTKLEATRNARDNGEGIVMYQICPNCGIEFIPPSNDYDYICLKCIAGQS